MNDSANATSVQSRFFGSALEIDFSIKIFGREIFHFHYPPQND